MADENTRPEGSDAPSAASRSSLDQQFGAAGPNRDRPQSDQEREAERRRMLAGPDGARPLPPTPTAPLHPGTGKPMDADDLPRGQVFKVGLSGVDHSLPIDPPEPASPPTSMGTPEERERAENPETAGPAGGVAVGPRSTAEAAVPNPGDAQRETLVNEGAFPTGAGERPDETR